MHQRLKPIAHRFDYPFYYFSFDLSQLSTLSNSVYFFGYNKRAPFSLWDKDYLMRGNMPLREKVLTILKDFPEHTKIEKIELLTSAKLFGHVFNPASFFMCYDKDQNVKFILAQVRNTFDEMHVYILEQPLQEKASKFMRRYVVPKEFHVSPFFDMKGEYEFQFQMQKTRSDIHVNLLKEGKPVLISRLSGTFRELNSKNLIQTFFRYPLTVFLTLPRIHYQAALLYFKKKLKTFKKPPPLSSMTMRVARPKIRHKIAMRMLDSYLGRIQKGCLRFNLPEEKVKTYGNPQTGDTVTMTIWNYDAFWKIVKDAGIGLGEGYVDYDWDTDDVTRVLNFFIANKPYLERKTSSLSWLGDFFNKLKHRKRRNKIGRSKKNIGDHYDLGNKFFSLFLDSTMTYSCAYYETSDQSLELAQRAKIKRLLEKAELSAEDHLLEIGCGWGALAIEAVKQTGCRYTGITLSEEQLKWAQALSKREGLEDKIEFKLCDYRHLEGTFDKIISIEMIEAVGHEYLPEYFKVLDRALKPGGRVVLQAITIPKERYKDYVNSCDWIQKHIFPGGHLPSLEILEKVSVENSELSFTQKENIGPHYAKTLRDWRLRLLERAEEMKSLGFEERDVRKWEYYFAYCEAGYEMNYLENYQLVMMRKKDARLNAEKSSVNV